MERKPTSLPRRTELALESLENPEKGHTTDASALEPPQTLLHITRIKVASHESRMDTVEPRIGLSLLT